MKALHKRSPSDEAAALSPEERVRRMEAYFDTVLQAWHADRETVGKDPALREAVCQLKTYYEGGLWLADYDADSAGLLPRDLKRGVLSQDGLYDLLAELEPAIETRKNSERGAGMLYNVYFSARGTTQTCAALIGSKLANDEQSYNWLYQARRVPLELRREDVLLFSMPVYGGVIPLFCAEQIGLLRGHRTPAVICAVYGNRHYDHALLQMQQLLTKQGFTVVAAGAFLAAHSIFPKAGAGRPDASDRGAMEAFAERCSVLLQKGEPYGELRLPGNAEYDPAILKKPRFQPATQQTCVGCGACVQACPVQAISAETPDKIIAERCIACGACIEACPLYARGYWGDAYEAAQEGFVEKNAAYRQPEVFFPTEH